MPDRITSGGESFITCASASMTASVGVPVTEKRRSSCFLSRTGVVRVNEWPAPDCSSVGATIHTSSLSLRATASSSLRPRAFTPSSLVSSIRMAESLWRGRLEPATARRQGATLRHIRNMLAISSRLPRQCLLRLWRLIIGRAWGRPTYLVHKYRESLEDLPRLNRWDGTAAAALGSSAGVPGPCAGRALMATALVDLYGGDDFEPFDRLILAEGYSP